MRYILRNLSMEHFVHQMTLKLNLTIWHEAVLPAFVVLPTLLPEIVVTFALQSAVFQIFQISGLSHRLPF